MRLIITRKYEVPPPGNQYSNPYRFHALLELTDEEKEFVAKYQLGGHGLMKSHGIIRTVEHLIQGSNEVAASLDIIIGNERILRDACAALPGMFDYCRSFGEKTVVEYS